MDNVELIHSHIDGQPAESLTQLTYDPEWYEELDSGSHTMFAESQSVHRLSLSDGEWRQMVNEWGEEYP